MVRRRSVKEIEGRKKYAKSKKGKLSRKKYKQSTKGKISTKKYKQSEMGKAAAIRYCEKNRTQINERANEHNRKLKASIVNHYGGKCSCCGETLLDFLTIDHVNNDGAEHRRKHKSQHKSSLSGPAFYRWLRNNNFPKEYQVLCWNCNCGKMINKGICPHKRGI